MWFILALSSALCEAVQGWLSKKSTTHANEYAIVFYQRFFSLLVLLPLTLTHIPDHFDQQMWLPLGIVIALDTVAAVLFVKALKYAPLSLIAPIASLTPIGILIAAIFINHELPGVFGIVGVVLSVIGVYVLQLSKRSQNFWAPLTSLLRDPGPRCLLGVVLLWSITSPLDKNLVQLTNPFFYVGLVNIGYTLATLPLAIWHSRCQPGFWQQSKSLWPLGVVAGLGLLFQMLALPLTFAAYVIAVKLSSGVISVWFGKFFFQEKKIRERLIGTGIILAGIMLILFT